MNHWSSFRQAGQSFTGRLRFNNRRLFGPLGHVPPAEFEQMYYSQNQSPVMEAGLN